MCSSDVISEYMTRRRCIGERSERLRPNPTARDLFGVGGMSHEWPEVGHGVGRGPRARKRGSGGGWATMRWLSGSIQARIKRITELDYDIDEARWTLAQLEVDT